jgi:NADPH:quinone reductase-like Zn-dependent oxidoreductase
MDLQILGVDIAGTVVEVGADVTSFKEGDRVAALAPGTIDGNLASAAFQLYTVVPARVAARIPDDMHFTRAVVLPLALTTASWGLFEPSFLGIEAPTTSAPAPMQDSKRIVLVWGGSSSVGSCAIQLAAAAGLTVFATASSKNFDYVKALGASQVFDYSHPEIVSHMVAAAQGKEIVGAYDAITSDATTMACANFLKDFGRGKILCTGPNYSGLVMPDGVQRLNGPPPRSGADGGPTIWQRVWADFMGNGLAKGKLKANPEPLVVGVGLERLQEGIDMCRKGVSAKKIVVELDVLSS